MIGARNAAFSLFALVMMTGLAAGAQQPTSQWQTRLGLSLIHI